MALDINPVSGHMCRCEITCENVRLTICVDVRSHMWLSVYRCECQITCVLVSSDVCKSVYMCVNHVTCVYMRSHEVRM